MPSEDLFFIFTFRTNLFIFKTSIVIFRIYPVLFVKNPVISRIFSVTFMTNLDIFRTNRAIFSTYEEEQSVLLQNSPRIKMFDFFYANIFMSKIDKKI